jgi:RimJ/RimL family protein N-acetyltransferase
MSVIKPIMKHVPEHIITPHLELRVPRAGDGVKVHEALIDGYEDYVYWLNFPETVPTVEAVEEDCRKHAAEFILRNNIRYLIINKQTQEVMGRCSIPSCQSNWKIPMFGISYFIAKRFRGNGYASETVNALTRMAFEVLNALKVQVKADPDNVASAKIPQRLGFELEAKQKGEWFRKDKPLAEVYTYALFDLKSLRPLVVRYE